ncbi:glycosyltransferase [Rhodococcus qingshengii]|uniref:glycosyltransferase n=1 Tax=Rhodococcus qingshengii TaxID=334542 RepID=UPI0024B99D15|nr:glycosyltransferase [Rhodococcus qingshengii]MDJ0487143.1 glycosyltransferase [Rhodococcus qingshengii]
MKPRLVSVVIPTYNAVDTIGEQLQALASQDYAGPYEAVVSDNSSTDGLRDFINTHPLAETITLRWVSASQTQGPSHARNVGAEHADGDFIAFCDADDRVHTSWLTQLVMAAEDADLVSGGIETASINAPEVSAWRELKPKPDPYSFDSYLPHMMGCNFGAWKSSYQSVGGCDETMRVGEDVDVSWRMQQAGMKFAYEPKALVAYRLRSGLSTMWRQTVSFGIANVDLYSKHRQFGFKRSSFRALAIELAGLLLLNPLVPQRITHLPRGKWVAHAGLLAGRIKGSIVLRTFYL